MFAKQRREEEASSNSELIKVKFRHFTFSHSYWGGSDPSRRNYTRIEIRYCEPQEALRLLTKGEELSYGSGIEFTRVD